MNRKTQSTSHGLPPAGAGSRLAVPLTVAVVLIITSGVAWMSLEDSDGATQLRGVSVAGAASASNASGGMDTSFDVSFEQFTGMVRERSAVVVDARSRQQYHAGHVPGAVHWPANQPDAALPDRLKEFGHSLPVIVYCSSARCPDADTVAGRLRERGYAHVRVFRGGWEQWQDRQARVE